MDPWRPRGGHGSLPGTEARWEAYWAMRAPYDRAAYYLQHGRTDHLDDALDFLVMRPRFLQSGYIAERMLRFLSRPVLSQRQRVRVIAIAEAIASEGYTREAQEAKKLLIRLYTSQHNV